MNEATVDKMEDIRKALQLAVCRIIFDEDREQGTRTTPDAVTALTELTFQYATKSLVPDLYTFSTHANRKSTISPDDVAVALRKLQPDQVEAFKKDFCRNGNKTAPSKGYSSNTRNRKEDVGYKKSATTIGNRRKRKESEVLSLSSSSSSSDDCENIDNNITTRKKSKLSKIGGGTRQFQSNASAFLSKTKAKGRNKTRNESLLNKFQLQPKYDADYHDTSSSDDDDINESPSKYLGMAKTHPPKAAQDAHITKGERKIINKAKTKSNSLGKNNRQLDKDDDTSDSDEAFLERNTKITKKNSDDGHEHSGDDSSDRGNTSKSKKNEDGLIDRGASKQSQVAEALANLSSDSGMDEDDSDDENAIRVDLSKSTRRVIDSDDSD